MEIGIIADTHDNITAIQKAVHFFNTQDLKYVIHVVGYPQEKPIFSYNGTRKITLEKIDAEGRLLYERKIVYEKIKPPLYQIFPFDFFSEIVIPAKLKDEHYLTYQLEPLKQLPKEETQKNVIKNAGELRDRLRMPVSR